jgi:hypothetical protein
VSKRAASTRSTCTNLHRRTNFREVRQRFLIVCGGEQTEPNYFKAFRTPKVVVTVQAIGKSPKEVVEKARKKIQEERRQGEEYDQVWCVFDRDEFPNQDFNEAIALARRLGMKVAYSNEAFELWYLLHFQYLVTGMSRRDYIDRLKSLFGHPYAKNSEAMYTELEGHITNAMRNAERLLTQYEPLNPAQDNPSTTVHLLVEQLLRYVR